MMRCISRQNERALTSYLPSANSHPECQSVPLLIFSSCVDVVLSMLSGGTPTGCNTRSCVAPLLASISEHSLCHLPLLPIASNASATPITAALSPTSAVSSSSAPQFDSRSTHFPLMPAAIRPSPQIFQSHSTVQGTSLSSFTQETRDRAVTNSPVIILKPPPDSRINIETSTSSAIFSSLPATQISNLSDQAIQSSFHSNLQSFDPQQISAVRAKGLPISTLLFGLQSNSATNANLVILNPNATTNLILNPNPELPFYSRGVNRPHSAFRQIQSNANTNTSSITPPDQNGTRCYKDSLHGCAGTLIPAPAALSASPSTIEGGSSASQISLGTRVQPRHQQQHQRQHQHQHQQQLQQQHQQRQQKQQQEYRQRPVIDYLHHHPIESIHSSLQFSSSLSSPLNQVQSQWRSQASPHLYLHSATSNLLTSTRTFSNHPSPVVHYSTTPNQSVILPSSHTSSEPSSTPTYCPHSIVSQAEPESHRQPDDAFFAPSIDFPFAVNPVLPSSQLMSSCHHPRLQQSRKQLDPPYPSIPLIQSPPAANSYPSTTIRFISASIPLPMSPKHGSIPVFADAASSSFVPPLSSSASSSSGFPPTVCSSKSASYRLLQHVPKQPYHVLVIWLSRGTAQSLAIPMITGRILKLEADPGFTAPMNVNSSSSSNGAPAPPPSIIHNRGGERKDMEDQRGKDRKVETEGVGDSHCVLRSSSTSGELPLTSTSRRGTKHKSTPATERIANNRRCKATIEIEVDKCQGEEAVCSLSSSVAVLRSSNFERDRKSDGHQGDQDEDAQFRTDSEDQEEIPIAIEATSGKEAETETESVLRYGGIEKPQNRRGNGVKFARIEERERNIASGSEGHCVQASVFGTVPSAFCLIPSDQVEVARRSSSEVLTSVPTSRSAESPSSVAVSSYSLVSESPPQSDPTPLTCVHVRVMGSPNPPVNQLFFVAKGHWNLAEITYMCKKTKRAESFITILRLIVISVLFRVVRRL